MNKCAEQPSFKIAFVQMRKFPAFIKPLRVNSTFLIRQKMTGDRIHDHLALQAFFNVFFFELLL